MLLWKISTVFLQVKSDRSVTYHRKHMLGVAVRQGNLSTS